MVPYSFVAYDQIDSGLNQNGPYLVSIVGVDRLENWADSDADVRRLRKKSWMDRIIADLDGQFPGIGSAVVQYEMSTAETFHHYLNTPDGAIYGFAPQTRGFMPRPEWPLTVFTWRPPSPAAVVSRGPSSVGIGRHVRR
jgi:phytoene dehydrogenase-like protein